MQYKNFTLDKFQEDAIRHVEEGKSVVVSAATGTGKTLIADYVINKFINEGKIIIYTAPIKALSNQKYKDFRREYGEDRVGIMTGDIVINPSAPLLVMTTEIYRNMLMSRDNIIYNLSYVIFDEIHFISDIERGTVWEESIIFSPKHVRFLCLSATIPNAAEFADWIQLTKDHPVMVVEYLKRAVPLKHFVYDIHLGLAELKDLRRDQEIPDYYKVMPAKRGKRKKAARIKVPSHIDMIKEMKKELPGIFFVFSRKACEENARDLSRVLSFTSSSERSEIMKYFSEHIDAEIRKLDSVRKLSGIIGHGIAYHHAGLLPRLKEIVENLFERGLIKVLYTTETFAVGVNMPARTVFFGALNKFDGVNFRMVNSKEYFQLAGRAGRRGIDEVGYVVVLIDRNTLDVEKLLDVTSADKDPIHSRFQLSINSVLNLIKNHSPEEIEVILKNSFDYYLRRKDNRNIRIMASFNHKKELLQRMGYMSQGFLTEKGEFGTGIYSNEIIISEIFNSSIAEELTENQLLIVIAALEYEERGSDHFATKGVDQTYRHILSILARSQYVIKNINQRNLLRMIRIVSHWANNGDFDDLLQLSSLAEGDIIRLFRRIIDVLHQVQKSTTNKNVAEKVARCKERIDRDIVEVVF